MARPRWELIGIGLVGVPVALDLHRGAQSRPLAGDLRASELVSAADAFMGPTVRALLVRLAHKDDYTAEHTRGVALRAVQVGEELGLAPVRLRELAIGGLLHDVGKLAVPNEILQKPGALTDDEFDVIKRHPELGSELVRAARLLRPGGAAGARPPRAARRQRLPARAAARPTSTSRPASWPSATSSTRCSPSASTATRGRSRTPST